MPFSQQNTPSREESGMCEQRQEPSCDSSAWSPSEPYNRHLLRPVWLPSAFWNTGNAQRGSHIPTILEQVRARQRDVYVCMCTHRYNADISCRLLLRTGSGGTIKTILSLLLTFLPRSYGGQRETCRQVQGCLSFDLLSI